MTAEFCDMEGAAFSEVPNNEEHEAHIRSLIQREQAYKLVFYTLVSPKELDDDLVIHLDLPEPKTKEDKRAKKIAEIDAYRDAYLKTYNELCELGIMRPSFDYMSQNGFGLSLGDLLDDEAVDALLVKDEEVMRTKIERNTAE